MMLGLDFPNERLLTNTIDRLISLDDGSEEAIRDAISVVAFKKAYFANGELIVERAETNERMGRCDPFIPTNVDMGGTLRNFDATIDQLTRVVRQISTNQRRMSGSGEYAPPRRGVTQSAWRRHGPNQTRQFDTVTWQHRE